MLDGMWKGCSFIDSFGCADIIETISQLNVVIQSQRMVIASDDWKCPFVTEYLIDRLILLTPWPQADVAVILKSLTLYRIMDEKMGIKSMFS